MGLGIRGRASTGPLHPPCCPLPSPPSTPTFPLRASQPQLQPGQDCIILGFVHRAAGGGVGPAVRAPPPFLLISFHSLLGNPPSSLLRLTAPPPWELSASPVALRSLSTFSCSPGTPEAKGRRLGRNAEIPTRLETALIMSVPHPVEGRCHPQKKHLVAVRVRSLRIWEQG